MGHPVTTNPMVIMVINMTVVFLVLIVLMYLIQLIHFLDPTKKEEQRAETERKLPVQVQKTEAIPEEQDTPEEIVAVIAAAVAFCNGGTIRAIRPLKDSAWRDLGRMGR